MKELREKPTLGPALFDKLKLFYETNGGQGQSIKRVDSHIDYNRVSMTCFFNAVFFSDSTMVRKFEVVRMFRFRVSKQSSSKMAPQFYHFSFN